MSEEQAFDNYFGAYVSQQQQLLQSLSQQTAEIADLKLKTAHSTTSAPKAAGKITKGKAKR